MDPNAVHIMDFVRKFNIVTLSVIGGIGLLGNVLVVAAIVRNFRLRSFTNLFILSLAVTHLCCIVRLFLHVYSISARSWQFGMFGCVVDSTVWGIFLITSSVFVVILCVTRLVNDRWPISFSKIPMSRIPVIVSCVGWVLSAVFIAPYLAFTKLDLSGAFCITDWSNDRNLYLYTFVIGFALPVSLVVVVFFLYLLDKFCAPKRMVSCSPYEEETDKRATKLVVALSVTHILCRIPIYLVWMNHAFPSMSVTHSFSWDTFVLVNTVSEVILNSSVAVTPLVCLCLSEDIRTTVVKILTCSDVNRYSNEIQLGDRSRVGKGGYEGIELITCQKPDERESSPPVMNGGSKNQGFLQTPNGDLDNAA